MRSARARAARLTRRMAAAHSHANLSAAGLLKLSVTDERAAGAGGAGGTGYVELLRRNRDFRQLWLGQVVSQLGDWFNTIAFIRSCCA